MDHRCRRNDIVVRQSLTSSPPAFDSELDGDSTKLYGTAMIAARIHIVDKKLKRSKLKKGGRGALVNIPSLESHDVVSYVLCVAGNPDDIHRELPPLHVSTPYLP